MSVVTVPEGVALNYDTVSGRPFRNNLGNWAYGPPDGTASDTITTGTASTVPDNTSVVYVNPAAVIAAYNLTMPANPADGDELKIIFGGAIANGSAVVTALTLTANTGQTLYGDAPVNPVTGGTVLIYKYSSALTRWTNVQSPNALAASIREVAAATTVTGADFTVIYNGNSAATVAITMPAAASVANQVFHIINQNTVAGGTLTLSIGYKNFAGAITTVIPISSGVTIQSDGTNYNQI